MIKFTHVSFRRVLIFLGVLAAYFAFGWLGLTLATINQNTSPIWAPSGIAIGALILFGNWVTPAIFIGAILTNLIVDTPLLGLLGIATGNTLEAFTGAQIILWFLNRDRSNTYSEFYGLTIGSITASFVSASIGVSTLYLLDTITFDEYLYSWYTWWSGDAVGILVILPFFIELYLSKRDTWKIKTSTFFEGLLLLTFIVSLTLLVFTQNLNQAFSWILTPFFIISGIKLGQLATRFILIMTGFLIIFLTMKGYAPFEFGDLNLNLIYLQSLLASYAFAILFVRPFATNFFVSKKFILGNLLGWVCLFFVILIQSNSEKQFLEDDLKKSIESSIDSLHDEIDKYQLLLKSGGSMLTLKPDMTRSDWEGYVSSLNLDSYYKGIFGLGVITYVPKEDESKFFKEAKNLGIHDLRIKTVNKDFSKTTKDMLIVTFIEPMAENYEAVGLDVGSDPVRRSTAEKSRAIRDIVSTTPIRMIQDEFKRSAFGIFNPIWREDKSFKGWVFAPIIHEIFFSEASKFNSEILNIRVFQDGQMVYSSFKPDEKPKKTDFNKRKIITIFNQDYTIEFYPTDIFFTRHKGMSGALALLLNLFMLFIAGFLLEQLTFGQKAEELITQKVKELETSKVQLINSNKMATLGKMASSMAHEINNPLAIILMKIKVITIMLKELNVEDSQIMEEIGKIGHTTHRIENIVKGLKTFSRVSQNDPFEIISFKEVIVETLDLSLEKMKNNNVDFKITEIPAVFILTRPSQLLQVFLNLLNNSMDAIEYLDEKWIAMDFKITHSRLIITLTDSGKGIKNDIAKQIMDPFFTTKDVGRGTGLGLSIARSIVEDHGGILWLDQSSFNTSFVIELPIHRSGQGFN